MIPPESDAGWRNDANLEIGSHPDRCKIPGAAGLTIASTWQRALFHRNNSGDSQWREFSRISAP